MVWEYNRELFTQLLFTSVRETLFKLLNDDKHLGARPGMIMSLHTWGSNLITHPHIHCLVTGGGLTEDGTWKKVSTQTRIGPPTRRPAIDPLP